MLLIPDRQCTDPALNLALEEYVLRAFRQQGDCLSLYVNAPAVVLGKHQNVAHEANLLACDALQLPVVRRISGGGTVVHDLGNLNFAFITRQTLKNVNNYRLFVQPIVELLRDYHIPAELDAANNIVARGKKLSGNAQFTTAGRLLTHGTLLINSNLERIHKALAADSQKQVVSRASRSRPAVIANVNSLRSGPAITVKEMKMALQQKLLGNDFDELKITKRDWEEIHRLAEEKYRSMEWNYGRSPHSSVELVRNGNRVRFQLNEGRIQSVQVENNPALEAQLQSFSGLPYHVPSIRAKAKSLQVELNMDAETVLHFLF